MLNEGEKIKVAFFCLVNETKYILGNDHVQYFYNEFFILISLYSYMLKVISLPFLIFFP